MPLAAHPAHAARRAARIPRRKTLAPAKEVEPRKDKDDLDQLMLFAPQRTAPPLALMLTVQYHAVGECIAHAHRTCNCVKTSSMSQSPADAWREMGRRYKARCRGRAGRDTPTDRSLPARPRSWPVRERNTVPDPPALTKLSSTTQKSFPVISRAAAGPVRRTASTNTPGDASRLSSSQAVPQPTFLLRQESLLLRMRELRHAQAHRAMGFQ